MPDPTLLIENLRTHLFAPRGAVRAVDGVNLRVDPGEVVGLVGESGSGKTMLARSILRLLPPSSRIVYLGKVVEIAVASDLCAHPKHPYTAALLDSIPTPDPGVERQRRPHLLQGEPPSPANPPNGCRFHPRRPIARVPGVCRDEEPLFDAYDGSPHHLVACHFAGERVEA